MVAPAIGRPVSTCSTRPRTVAVWANSGGRADNAEEKEHRDPATSEGVVKNF